jgi:hypothetical protein
MRAETLEKKDSPASLRKGVAACLKLSVPNLSRDSIPCAVVFSPSTLLFLFYHAMEKNPMQPFLNFSHSPLCMIFHNPT